MVRVAPAAGSMTYGVYRSPVAWSKYSSFSPLRRGVGLEIEVRAVGDPLQLAPAPRELELHVGRGHRVVRQLVSGVRAQAQHVLGDAEVDVPLEPLVAPVVKPPGRLVRRDEVLHLHLLELPGAEHEVAGGDLVAKGLADLGDPERRSLARRLQHVEEVDEVPLGGLRAQVGDVALVLYRTHVGLEHQVEGPGLGEVGAAAVGAVHLPVARIRLQVVGPPAFLAVAAVDQGVGEVGQVARRLPDLRAGQDGRVEPHHFVAELDHRPPPGVFDVAQHQHAQRAVVVGGAEPAVDLSRGEDEAARLAQPHDVIHARRHRTEATRLGIRAQRGLPAAIPGPAGARSAGAARDGLRGRWWRGR